MIDDLSRENALELCKLKLLQLNSLNHALRKTKSEVEELCRKYCFSVSFEPPAVDGEAVE